ncbi:MAG: site-specific DNA-methyltransferase [Spirochaetaceae bacterium]|nr:site-specific DNA-methyltransferase [Spirochaetaceae bacterium]
MIRELGHADHIFTDPPFLYLKQDFDKPFDESLLFENAKRILPDNGFISLFGRGTSFYRWNTRLAELGFKFREELVWDKRRSSGIAKHITRVHETISVHTKKTGILNTPRVPYEEMRAYSLDRIAYDLRRISSRLDKPDGIEKLKIVIAEKKARLEFDAHSKYGVSFSEDRMYADTCCERLCMIENGMLEKSIISIGRTHCNAVHPTQKPTYLAKRIIALISSPGDTIYDPFMGSGSFGVACMDMGRKYIGSEISAEYYKTAVDRIKQSGYENGRDSEAGLEASEEGQA